MVRRLLIVRLLGEFTVELDGRLVGDHAWRRRRAAALVKLLALAADHRLVRDEAIEALWPGLDPAAGGANLRKAAHHARRAMAADDAVVLDGVTVRLLPGAEIRTDVAEFVAAAQQALACGDAGRARAAAALYHGDLLPDDRYEPWCEPERRQLRARYLEVLAVGRQWGRLLAADPTSEHAHRGIMRERLDAGDRAGALRQFDRLRTVLRDELGISPDPESVALYERALTADGRDVPTPAERARALLAWGTIHWERADLTEAERTALEARALAVDAGLGRELADASELLALVSYAQGRWREVFGREFVETVRRTPQLAPFVYDANMCMSEFALYEADGIHSVGDFADDLLATADRSGSVQARALGLLLRGEVRLLTGDDPDAAHADLIESARLHEDSASPTGVALATERLAQVAAVRGDRRSAERLHRRALELAAGSAVAHHLLPLIYGAMLEDTIGGDGLATLAEADAALAGVSPCAPCSMSWHLGVAVLSARTGRDDRARIHLTEADRIAGMWRAGPWRAAVAEAQATVRRMAEPDSDEVRSLLRTAADGFARARRRRDATRCRAALEAMPP